MNGRHGKTRRVAGGDRVLSHNTPHLLLAAGKGGVDLDHIVVAGHRHHAESLAHSREKAPACVYARAWESECVFVCARTSVGTRVRVSASAASARMRTGAWKRAD